jgi:TolA-binding protein
LTDVLARLDTLERQIARMTAASEENQNSLAQLQRKFDEAQAVLATERAAQAAAAVPTQPSGSLSLPQLGSSSPAVRSTPTPTPSSATPRATPTPAASRPAATTPTPSAAPSAARLAAVRAIAKPSTDNPGDDEYSYGFRLYEAGYFAEARQQLALFLRKYPNHERVSYGRNLLGRAYLDDGQPREAAKYFFDNYQANKQGARAADSLLFLSETMIAIGDNSRACIALAEFGDTYPALATGRLKEQYDRTKSKVRCT